MRTRTHTSGTTQTYECPNGKINADGSFSAPTSIWKTYSIPRYTYDCMNDVVTPHFHRLKNRGIIINNPMDKTVIVEDISATPFIQRWATTTGGGYWYNGIVSFTYAANSNAYLTGSSIDVDRLKDIAVTSAWSKMDRSEIAALATAAEGRETIGSLISIMKRVVNVTRAIRKLNVRALKKEIKPKELANRYLEARYALRPMYYDAKGVMAAWYQAAVPTRQTYRGYATDSVTSIANDQVLYQSQYSKIVGTKTVSRTVEVRSGVLAKVEDVSRAMAWGLDQPFEAIWELIPYSFIVDWFFNVGKTIASWTPNVGLKELASWCVVNDTTLQSITGTGIPLYPNTNILYRELEFSGYRSRSVSSKTRIVSPTRSFVPSFTVRLDALKLLDLVLIAKNHVSA